MFSVALNASMCALNVGVYAVYGKPWNLAAFVLSGLLTVFFIVNYREGRWW